MARRTEAFAIDGVQYELTQLGGVEGLGLFHELRKLALPAVRQLIENDGLLQTLKGADLDALDPTTAAKLFALLFSLFESLPKALELELAGKFATSGKVVIGGVLLPLGGLQDGGIFDQHFAGNFGSYQKWLLQGIKLNFASFLGSSGNAGSPKATP